MYVVAAPRGMGFSGEEASCRESIVFQLLFGRPWLALAVGFTVGLLAFWAEKRALRAYVAKPENIDQLSQWYRLPVSERGKFRPDCWKTFFNPRLYVGYIAALVLICVLRFSFTACLIGLAIPMVLVYPEYRKMYQGVISRLTNADVVGCEVAREWQNIHRWLRVLLTATAVALACVMAVLLYRAARIALKDHPLGSGGGETWLYAEEVVEPRPQIAIARVLES